MDLVDEKNNRLFTTTIFEMPEKAPTSRHHSGCNSDGVHKMAAVYFQIFRRIT